MDVFEYGMQEYLANYELASANLEGLFFEHHDEVSVGKPGSTDPTDVMSGRLNGNDPERRVGTALLLSVMSGDKLQLEVNSFYENYNKTDDNPVNEADMMESVIGTLTAGIGGTGGGEVHNPEMVGTLFTPDNWAAFNNAFSNQIDPDKPKAFLNYMLFSEGGAFIREGSGRMQANGDGTWATMSTTQPIIIPENGYIANCR